MQIHPLTIPQNLSALFEKLWPEHPKNKIANGINKQLEKMTIADSNLLFSCEPEEILPLLERFWRAQKLKSFE